MEWNNDDYDYDDDDYDDYDYDDDDDDYDDYDYDDYNYDYYDYDDYDYDYDDYDYDDGIYRWNDAGVIRHNSERRSSLTFQHYSIPLFHSIPCFRGSQIILDMTMGCQIFFPTASATKYY